MRGCIADADVADVADAANAADVAAAAPGSATERRCDGNRRCVQKQQQQQHYGARAASAKTRNGLLLAGAD